MGTKTTRLDLSKPGENDYYNQQTEQADNWQKVDDYAVYTDRDKNAIWGGLDGGGLIEDPTVVKEVGKRYIGADGKAYICLVPSNINNSTNYMPCNVVDNLDKLQNLIEVENLTYKGTNHGLTYTIIVKRRGFICNINITAHGTLTSTDPVILVLPVELRPLNKIRLTGFGSNSDWIIKPNGDIQTSGSVYTEKNYNDIGLTYGV